MTETFTERTAGIWVPLVFYVLGGIYMLSVWGLYDRAAYHLTVLGVLSILVAVALYMVSRWGSIIGLLTFPLFFLEFLLALNTSVNLGLESYSYHHGPQRILRGLLGLLGLLADTTYRQAQYSQKRPSAGRTARTSSSD